MSETESTTKIKETEETTAATSEVMDVRPADMEAAVSRKFADDDEGSAANACRKMSRILSASQKGGMPAPKTLTYWLYRMITDDDETQILRDKCHVAIAAPEVNAPIYTYDIKQLEGMLTKLDAGEDLSEMEMENLGECLRLTLKWIDVVVRTKTNRNVSKGMRGKKSQKVA